MMQLSLQIFEYENRREFRIIDRNGEPWFVLGEVCRELEISNASDAARRLDDDEKGVVNIDTLGGPQKTLIINESGLYSLILTSRKEAAKKFKKWVTAEVLPSIRRTGNYHGKVPAFIRRFNDNWDRVSPGHFSVISELVIRLYGRLEMVGHIMADKAKNGKELRPDVSVGRVFADWLRKRHPDLADDFTEYMHKTAAGDFPARQYPMNMLPLYIEFVDNVWLPGYAEPYFKTRDPAALQHLPKLLPMSHKAKPALPRTGINSNRAAKKKSA
jgi:prophage antirepressor-like protein